MALKKKNSKAKNKSSDKIKEYYEALDLMTWWEEFSTACMPNGIQKYKTVWSFIIAKSKIKWQREFLYWLLGPIGTSEVYKQYAQIDWEKKREVGFWHSSENIKQLSTDVRSKQNALASMKELGKINLEIIGSYLELKRQIDREYNGRIFLPNLSQKENHIRAAAYMQLQRQLLDMQKEAQLLFGRTQGLDLERLDEFFSLFGKGIGETANLMHAGLVDLGPKTIEGVSTDPATTAMRDVLAMVTKKIRDQELQPPDQDMEDIIDTAAKKQKPVLVPARKG